VTATLSSPNFGVAITQPYSDYADVPASGNRTNSTPFQISTLSSLICGVDITLELTLNTSSHGSFVVPFVLRTGSPATVPLRFDVSAITNIPDVGTIESTNFVGAFSGPLKKVAVSLWLTHPHDSDLNLSLVSPDGVIIDLSSGNGAGADFGTNCSPDIGRTTFDDSAATAITAGASPFKGTFRPETSLSALDNGTAIGNWRLRVTDNVGGSLGALRCWSLFLYPVECAPGAGACDVCLAPITNAITLVDPVAPARVSRNSVVATCAAPKVFPGVTPGSFHYDVYTFTNNTADDACVTVQLAASCDLQAVAYLDTFVPSDVSSNYLADSGFSTVGAGGTLTFSFSVPAGARFQVVVNEIVNNTGCNYTLSLSGLPCAPPALVINPTTPAPNVRVHWPTSAGGFKLEAATSLTTTNWTTVTNEPVENLGRFNVTNSSAQPTNRFYRLHKP
jgi:subtilisin-like proprotein convertase family protein